ncbi:leader peptidase (prepilin peptidase) / N-methyltransferase [Tessaracoccus oleiagri]|uniref:Leader peptidase (Prepilin peptidase) / N-methyltransferase n=1 Tax=Tessaracoccus oleiagri TaxID=686624 RepID=A0A1G9MGY0_9ACTN|nr:leader peptidase (prepilin peptidase) / N-methyltransferase [Tessaracoccus oleiagri]
MIGVDLLILLLTALACALVAAAVTPLLRRELTSRGWVAWLHVPLAAAAGAGAAALAETTPELVAFAAAGTVIALLMVVDLLEHRLPDRLVAPAWLALVLPLTFTGDWNGLGRALLASVTCLVVYFALAWISPAGMGLGDVKFAAVVGTFLGWFGWSHVLWGTLLAFALNAVVSLLALIRGRRGSELPFGPLMVVGAILAVTFR